MKTPYICYTSMFLNRLLVRCSRIQQIGNRINANSKHKHNLYSTPTTDYDDYIHHQEELIEEFKTEVYKLYSFVKKNEHKFDSLKIGPF